MPELDCSIVTPSRSIFEGKIEYISAPGRLGDFGVLPGHESFVTVLDVGIIEIQPAGKEKFKLVIVGGYFEVSDDKVFVIADDVILKEDVNVEKAKEEAEKYKNELSSLNVNDANYYLVQRKLKKYEKMLELAS